ncbi:MAG: SAM-dependent methyltransferase [Gemmatimonadota bacterium]|nr:SAM-dependent methyltransferase [Gemmatimonadota bacterium]
MVASMKIAALGLLIVLTGAALYGEEELAFKVYPIGTVKRSEGRTYIEVPDKYSQGLQGLDEFSHVTVVYWLDKNDTPEKRTRLTTSRVSKGEAVGVFATHSPVRPNLVAISHCRIVSIEGNRVYIDEIDAFDDTPVIDLKCFIPYTYDRPDEEFRLPGWARRVVAERQKKTEKKD